MRDWLLALMAAVIVTATVALLAWVTVLILWRENHG